MKNGANKGTNNSAVVRKNQKLKEDIVRILNQSDNPKSTSDISFLLDKAWHTIDRTCMMLQIGGKLDGFKVGKMNLWRVK